MLDFAGGLAYGHGGELLANLPKGTNVYPAHETREILRGESIDYDRLAHTLAPVLVRAMSEVRLAVDVDRVHNALLGKERTNGPLWRYSTKTQTRH